MQKYTFFTVLPKKISPYQKMCVLLHPQLRYRKSKKISTFNYQFCKPWWWNGRHGRLKICCSQGREGSSPSRGTKKDFVIDSTRAKIQNPFFFYMSMFFCLAMSKKKCNFASQNKGCYIWIIRVHIVSGREFTSCREGVFRHIVAK